MELLILKEGFLFIKKLDKVFNEIEEISWRDIIEFFCRFGQLSIQLNNSTMNSYNCIDNNVVP